MDYNGNKMLNFVLAIVLTAAFIAGCSKSSAPEAVPQAPQETAQEKGVEDDSGYYDGEEPEDDVLPANRKVIKNANLEVEAEDSVALYEKITAYINGLGGYESSYSIDNYGDYSVIYATIKVPPEKLSAFIKFVGSNGKVINNTMSSEDITEDYFDIKTRLETKRKALEQYYELLKRANTIEEIVYVQGAIDEITVEIESYEGKLKLWDSMVSMSTVDITIRQDNDPIRIKKEIHWNAMSSEDMTYLIRSGFVTVVNLVVSIAQWLVVAVITLSPVIVIVIIVLILRQYLIRRYPKKPPKRKDEDKSTTQDE